MRPSAEIFESEDQNFVSGPIEEANIKQRGNLAQEKH
jgi:hypothetical protein